MLAETVQRCCSRSYALPSSQVHFNISARGSSERVFQKITEATKKAGVSRVPAVHENDMDLKISIGSIMLECKVNKTPSVLVTIPVSAQSLPRLPERTRYAHKCWYNGRQRVLNYERSRASRSCVA